MADEGVDLEMTDEFALPNTKALGDEDLSKSLKESLNKFPLLQWMKITVTQSEKKTTASMKMQDTFVVYLIETRVMDASMPGYGGDAKSAWRRYNEFELLRSYLDVTYPWVIIPPLPEKKATYTWQSTSVDRFSPGFIERRRAGLEIFLIRCAAHPLLSQDTIFMEFLQKEEHGWGETVKGTEFFSQTESKLKALNAQFRLKRSDRKFEELKNYCTELQSNIGNILKIRAHMCDKLYGIHKINGNYARVLHELSLIEKEVAEHLHSASSYMDVYSSRIDAQLEESEQFADHMKEYNAFGDSLRTVCRRYECAQYDVERADDSLVSKVNQRDALASNTGKTGFSLSGMKSKLFGADTPEQREMKLKQMDEQIVRAETELKRVQTYCQLFIEEALGEIDRFQRQKIQDLQEVLTSYAVQQVKQCQQGLAIWTGARDCFRKM